MAAATRPIRIPPSPPAVRMTWDNLLFLHWRIDPAVMRPLVPPELDLDLHDGAAWIGLVPFRMADCSFRGVPPLPGLANFFECNVRTYARHRGLPGVWFFSLDAQTRLPVFGGRQLWSLNYIHSRFEVKSDGDTTDYRLDRRRGPWPAGRTHVRWQIGAPLPTSTPGSLPHFLTERYWLFTRRRGRILAGEVRHPHWPLHSAELLHVDDTLIAAAGLPPSVTSQPPVILASPHIAVEGFALRDPPSGGEWLGTMPSP